RGPVAHGTNQPCDGLLRVGPLDTSTAMCALPVRQFTGITACHECVRELSTLEQRPALVGSKTCAMSLCELPQTLHTGRDTSRARVMQRAAAKGRKAGAEDDAGIDEVRVLDDALAQTCHALIDQRQNQPVGQLRGGRRVVHFAHDLAVLPGIEALAALAAEMALLHQRAHLRDKGWSLLPQLACDDLTDVQQHVETDDVR